ncbi:MAG: hypothetical protein WCQ00_03845 [bacterium]
MNRLLTHHKKPITDVLRMAQYALYCAMVRRKADCLENGVLFRDDETSYRVLVPQDDEKGGYEVFIIAEHHYGPLANRFYGEPPEGSLILSAKSVVKD